MKTSTTGQRLIKHYEKLAKLMRDGRLKAYLPTPNDVWTIGWGSTGPDIKADTIWTVAQADARFVSHLAGDEAAVSAAIKAPTTQAQFDAMVSLTYNIGRDAFRSSTLLRMHNAGNYAGAADQFPRWNKQAGKVLNGLTARRKIERTLYLTGRLDL